LIEEIGMKMILCGSTLGAAMASAIVCAVLLSSPASAVTLTKESVTLPESTRMFPGDSPGAKSTNSYCLMCHSASMVLNQPDLSKAAWLAEVNKMKDVMKAPIPEDQVAVIVEYLDGIKGKK
jgi:sulfite dehydrogenase (cytochrome) subunit B